MLYQGMRIFFLGFFIVGIAAVEIKSAEAAGVSDIVLDESLSLDLNTCHRLPIALIWTVLSGDMVCLEADQHPLDCLLTVQEKFADAPGVKQLERVLANVLSDTQYMIGALLIVEKMYYLLVLQGKVFVFTCDSETHLFTQIAEIDAWSFCQINESPVLCAWKKRMLY